MYTYELRIELPDASIEAVSLDASDVYTLYNEGNADDILMRCFTVQDETMERPLVIARYPLHRIISEEIKGYVNPIGAKHA